MTVECLVFTGETRHRRVFRHKMHKSIVQTVSSFRGYGVFRMVGATCIAGGLAFAQTGSNERAPAALINQYCTVCHSDALQTAGISLEKVNASQLSVNADTWEKVLRKVSAGQMPPAGMPRPDNAEMSAFASWLQIGLDSEAAAHPNPGRTPAHRLNRNEYSNAIRDLLALDIDPGTWLPVDDSGYGFDNVADVLSMSPVLIERYMSAAGKISRLATGYTDLKPVEAEYFEQKEAFRDIAKYIPRNERTNEDAPFGSAGGFTVRHYFPVDGEYLIRVKMTALEAFSFNLAGDEVFDLRIPIKAGVHLITTDTPRSEAMLEALTPPSKGFAYGRVGPPPPVPTTQLEVRLDGVRLNTFKVGEHFGIPDVGSVFIAGPYKVTGPGDTPSRRRIFVCKPSAPQAEEPCARKIISSLGHRAFRRPFVETDMKPLLALYRSGRRDGSFERGIELALQGILVSPNFLFRVEQDPPGAAAGSVSRVTDLELASRLSFFLWSSIPDDELLALAEKKQLSDPAVLRAQVTRLLQDPRSAAFVSNFAGQWLFLRNVETVKPDPVLFADFDYPLRQSMRKETELFFEAILREKRPITDLLSANFTFLNQRLAEHYGIPGIFGSRMRRVELDASSHRGGLLSQGSIMLVTSYPNRTSVVQRGKWILENLLGTPPPPPPPNVPALPEASASGEKKTLREMMERHRANAVCASCHSRMDPLGFSLENFDAIGRWRDKDGTARIDASGVLPDGTKFEGPSGLRTLLVSQRKDEFVSTFAEKLLLYALGRGIEAYDRPAVRRIVKGAAAENDSMQAFIQAVVESSQFQLRTAKTL